MGELYLVKPTKSMEAKALDYRQEFILFGEGHINGSNGFSHYESYDEWLKSVQSIEKETLTREKVHATTYFSIRKTDDKIIGTIQLRHSLSDELRRYGGHIGYGIRPTERQRGYGKEQLALVIEEAKRRGLSEVMITCDKDNTGSAKVITGNGGVLEWEGYFEPTQEVIQIYWIKI
jgi:predicted acetyltransferase